MWSDKDKERINRQPVPSNPAIDKSIPVATLKSLYSTMLTIRRFEEKLADILASSKEIKCPVQLYIGEEAVAVGVCANLRKEDYVFSNHRSHGHYIAKGGDISSLMAEVFCRATGCSKGRGGSMHLASPDLGLLGSPAIVGGSIPLSVGAALAFSLRGQDNVSVVFFGDGAVNEGVFHESLNFASLRKLPVIFICENNLYSTHMPISACLANTAIYEKAAAFNMPGTRIDGNNVSEVFRTSGRAIEAARRGQGPSLIECMTYRWRGHVGPSDDLDKGLRSKEELDSWIRRCPIKALEKSLLRQGILSERELTTMGKEVDNEIEAAITFARNSPYPEESSLLDNIFKA